MLVGEGLGFYSTPFFMLTLGDIKTEINKFTVKSGLSSRIPSWAHFVELDVVSRYPFWFRVKEGTLATVANKYEYTLSSRVDGRRVSSLTDETNNRHINIKSMARQLWDDPTPTTESGDIYSYYFVGLSKVQNQPSSSSTLSCVSSSNSDNTQQLLVRGTSGGVEVYETISLSGTTPVSSTNSYTFVESIQKSEITVGTITVTSNSGAVTIISLAPQDIAIECPKIRLRQTPGSVVNTRYWFYEKPRKMTENYEFPSVPEAFQWKTIMNGLLEIAHLNNQDYEQANMYHGKYEQGIREMVDWSGSFNGIEFKSKPPLLYNGRQLYDSNSLNGVIP